MQIVNCQLLVVNKINNFSQQKRNMYHNILRNNNQKISKAIQLAVSYKNHRKSLERIKPVINMPSLSKIKKNNHLVQNHVKYAQESRNVKNTLIKKQNESSSRRISITRSVYKTLANPQSRVVNSISRVVNKSLQQSTPQSRISHRPQLLSSSSQRSISSNYNSRSRRYKQIDQENKKIASRVLHPKMSKNYKFSQMDKQYQKQQEYLRIRSRFSQRSKSIMSSLMLDGLKMEKKDLGFLPQIDGRVFRNKKNETINTGRMDYRNGQEENEKRHNKTIQFATNMRTSIKRGK